MTASRLRNDHDRRLIVEHKDRHVVIHLLARHGADWDRPDPSLPYVHEAGGVDRALAQAELAAKGTYTRLGVLLDADLDPLARWEALRDRWRRAGLGVPDRLPREGWVGDQPSGRRFGAWIMPDNRVAGSLEVFLSHLIPPDDGRWTYAVEAVDGAVARGAPLRTHDLDKARIHTWLAWQRQPGLPPGLAIRTRFLGHDTPQALAFVSWFQRLYDAPT